MKTRKKKPPAWWDRRLAELLEGCSCSRRGLCPACVAHEAIGLERDLLHAKLKSTGETMNRKHERK